MGQTLARLFILREGLTTDDDVLPKRVRKAFSEGPMVDIEIAEEAFRWTGHRFYILME